MSDTTLNIPIPKNTWVDLYAASGIPVGEPLVVENTGVCDVSLAVQAAEPTKTHKSYNVLQRLSGVRLINNEGDPGAWAFCNAEEGEINVSQRLNDGFHPLFAASLHDGAGNPINSLDGAINVHLADVHASIVNDFFHRHDPDAVTTLATAAALGDVQIEVVSVASFAVGEYVHLGPVPNTQEIIHPQITVVDAINDILVLDRPIDNNYSIGDNVTQSIVNIVTGTSLASLTSHVFYRYSPRVGKTEHIKRILISMEHSSAADDSSFGNIPALTNGVVLRASIGGQVKTFTNWKSNGDLILDMYDVAYTSKAGGGNHGTSGRGSFSRIDVTVPLNALNGDYMELLVQDNLTGLISFRIKVQGHIEGE